MKKISMVLSVLFFVLIFPNILLSAGRTAFPIAKTLLDARALALSGAIIAENSWIGGVRLNPAAAAGETHSAEITYARHSLGMWSGLISSSHQVRRNIVAGIYISTFDYGELEYSERGSGLTGETFSAGENIFSGYVAGEIYEGIGIGGSVKYLWGSLEDEKASGAATDIGITWDAGWEMVKLAAVIRNLGIEFQGYGSSRDDLPTELLLGGCRTLRHLPLTIHAVGIFARSGEEDWTFDWVPGKPGFGFGLGGEFKVAVENQREPLFVRFGYRSRGQGMQVGYRLDLISGFTFGIGFKVREIGIDYAFAPMGALGDIHRFGITGKLPF